MSTSTMGTVTGRQPADSVAVSAQVAAIVAAAVLVTTGQIPQAGKYDLEVSLGYSGVAAAGKHILVEHRNAADNATLQIYALCPGGATLTLFLSRVDVALNERFRVIAGAVAGGAGEVSQALIRYTRLT